MACRDTNVHLPFNLRSIEIDDRPLVYLPARCRVRASIVDPHDKTLREVLKPLEHQFIHCVGRPLRPTEALFVKRCFPILTFIEHLFCQLIELRDLFEDDEDEVRDIESEAKQKFFFQWSIDLVPVLGCVCEAARVKGPRRLLV